jgi:hypothetical protein
MGQCHNKDGTQATVQFTVGQSECWRANGYSFTKQSDGTKLVNPNYAEPTGQCFNMDGTQTYPTQYTVSEDKCWDGNAHRWLGAKGVKINPNRPVPTPVVVTATPPPVEVPPVNDPVDEAAIKLAEEQAAQARADAAAAKKLLIEARNMMEQAQLERDALVLQAKTTADIKIEHDRIAAVKAATAQAAADKTSAQDAQDAKDLADKATADAITADLALKEAQQVVDQTTNIQSEAIIKVEVTSAVEESTNMRAELVAGAAKKNGIVVSSFNMLWLLLFIIIISIVIALYSVFASGSKINEINASLPA